MKDVKIEKVDGWYIATLKNANGFILVDKNLTELKEDLPKALRIFKNARNRKQNLRTV